MVENDSGVGENVLRFNERISTRDTLTPSPEERAAYIFNLIKAHNNNLTDWDLICFCTEYLGSLVPVYEWLDADDLIKRLTRRVQIAHYFRDEVPETGIK